MLRTLLVCCAFIFAFPGREGRSKPLDVQLAMRNVSLHLDEGIVLGISRLQGVMVSRSAGLPPVFDDANSYVLRLQTATMSMDVASLQNLMNRYVFANEGSPLKDVTVQVDEGKLKIKGKLHKGVEVPFSTTASVSTTQDGRLRLHAESLKALGVPAKGLLELFGLKLDDVMAIRKRRGVEVQDNDIIIAAGQVLPPPEIVGRLSKVSVSGNSLLQVFDDASNGRPSKLVLPSPSSPNYVYFGGGDIRFGKLTMHDADLQLIDTDPKDPFDFFPAKYSAQLVAGYSKNTPAKGLKTYMPDYGDLRSLPAKPGSDKEGKALPAKAEMDK
jgi:hypothetical protein